MRGGTDCFFVVVAVFHFERPFGQPQHVSPRHIRRNFLRFKFFANGKGWRLSASPGPRTRPYASFHSALPPEGPMLESPHFAGRGFEGQAPVVTEVLARRIQPLLSAKLVHFP